MSDHSSNKNEGNGTTGTPIRRRRKVESSEPENMTHDESNWLVSYADMMTLLFGFFVLLYSFSRVDEKKFEIIRKDVAKYFGGQVKVNPRVKKLEEEVTDIISQAGLEKSVSIVSRDSDLELRFQGNLHFVAGTANLTKDSAFVLNKVIDLIKRSVKADSVTVEGHTDDNPISSPMFPSNWELSSARASSVIREFEKYGFDPSKLTAEGFGSSRPMVPNRDSTGNPLQENQELNRRVIVDIGFSTEIDDAVKAMKTGKFVSADAPELDLNKPKTPLVYEGEGEPTWREKVTHDTTVMQEKLKLAEERLKESEEKNKAARKLMDLQARLQQVENRIETTDDQAQKYLAPTKGRVPASTKVKPTPDSTK